MRGSADGFSTGTPHVARLTPTVAAGAGGVSGEVELEAWVTAVAVSAANYNNTRSNRSSIRTEDGDGDGADDSTGGARVNYNNSRSNRSTVRPPDIVDDDLEEDGETFLAVARLDDRLKEATAAAWASISKRSARTGRNPQTERELFTALDEMDGLLAEMRAVLERCSTDSCAAALVNVTDRQADARLARRYAENGEWDAFGVRGVGDDIIVGDYLFAAPTFDPTGLFDPAERAALFRYLDGTPVVGERFTVCLPDAEVPGGNGTLREEVTPARLVEYLTGGIDGGRGVYSWGRVETSSERANEAGDCDDADERVRPAACGTTPHFVAEVSGPSAPGGRLAVVRADEGSVVVAAPSDQNGGAAGVCAPADGQGRVGMLTMRACSPGVWTQQTETGASTSVLVYRVMARPPACPAAFPGLLYVQRCVSDGQLVYTGGWVIDDASLYGNALTMVSVRGVTSVVGVNLDDIDGDGLTDLTATFEDVAGGDGWSYAAPVEQLVEEGVLPRELVEGDDSIIRKRPGRAKGGGPTLEINGDEYGFVTNIDATTPVLHLVNTRGASNEVKFKAGSELSKAVN